MRARTPPKNRHKFKCWTLTAPLTGKTSVQQAFPLWHHNYFQLGGPSVCLSFWPPHPHPPQVKRSSLVIFLQLPVTTERSKESWKPSTQTHYKVTNKDAEMSVNSRYQALWLTHTEHQKSHEQLSELSMTHNTCHHLLMFPDPPQRSQHVSSNPPPPRLALPDSLKGNNTADASMNQSQMKEMKEDCLSHLWNSS